MLRSVLSRACLAPRSLLRSPPAFAGVLASRTDLICSCNRLSSSVAASPLLRPALPTRFAVVALSGTQYKVAVDDLICVEKIDLPVGATVEARRVLLVGEAADTIIVRPFFSLKRVPVPTRLTPNACATLRSRRARPSSLTHACAPPSRNRATARRSSSLRRGGARATSGGGATARASLCCASAGLICHSTSSSR